MNINSKIYVAGHAGLAGSAIVRALRRKGYRNIMMATRDQVDLFDQDMVRHMFQRERPDYVVLAAARVGGIKANATYRGDFIWENIQIQNNVMAAAYEHHVTKLLFLGSSCIYPAECPQPMREEHLLTGPLERTNEPYAIAKIAGLKMCEAFNLQYGTDFFSVMPTNLYGLDDNFDFETSHLLPAFIRKFYLGACLQRGDLEAIEQNLDGLPVNETLEHHGITKDSITIWGSGEPRREFMHADDLAEACVYFMQSETKEFYLKHPAHQYVNVGTGIDHSVLEIAQMVKEASGYTGVILVDSTKPDGTFRKLLSVERLHATGWRHRIDLQEGIGLVYQQYSGV